MKELIKQLHSAGIGYEESTRQFRKLFIVYVLQQCGGNQCKAARVLGIFRNTLSRHMIDLGIPRAREIRSNSRTGALQQPWR